MKGSKRLRSGILVVALAFGMTATGCDNGTTDNNSNGKSAITWTYVKNSTFNSSFIWQIAYGAGKFVAVGAETAYSVDGVTWISVNKDSTWANTITYGGATGLGRFVTASTYDVIAYSNVQD